MAVSIPVLVQHWDRASLDDVCFALGREADVMRGVGPLLKPGPMTLRKGSVVYMPDGVMMRVRTVNEVMPGVECDDGVDSLGCRLGDIERPGWYAWSWIERCCSLYRPRRSYGG